MATNYKLAQVQGTSGVGTYSTLYNTGASTTAVVSTISICNTSSSARTYRIGVTGSAGTPGAGEWIVYDASVAGNDTTFLSIGLALGNTEYIRVSSSATDVAFSASVSEIS